MKTASYVALGVLCLAMAACNESAPTTSGGTASGGVKDQIVGKWQEGADKDEEMMEFAKDGTMTISMGPISIKGKYKFESDSVIVTEMENPFEPGKTQVIKLKVALTKDELSLTNEEEKVDAKKVKKFKRK